MAAGTLDGRESTDLHPQVLHRSDCLIIEAPCASVLLAMNLHAAREQDLQDAARLARGAGITDPDQLLALVADAYGADAATADTADFADRALSLALREGRTRQQRLDRGGGLVSRVTSSWRYSHHSRAA